VFVPAAAAGDWVVSISGYNVPMGPQTFAYVVDATLSGTAPPLPAVSIAATVASAAEAPLSSGAVTIARTGDTTSPLTVAYAVAGSATADADYVGLPGMATIPAGASTTTVEIAPIDDAAVEASETVIITLLSGAGYDLGMSASATVTITSDDLPPDLIVSALVVPSVAAAGGTASVTDTTKNQGTAPAQASETGFYLSANTVLDGADIPIGVRPVSPLTAAGLQTATTALTIPADTVAGTYYIIAKADWSGAISETKETNNLRVASATRIGPDLTVSMVTAPAVAGAGVPITISDSIRNVGGAGAADTSAAFYLSANTVIDAADDLLGQRVVPALSAATSHAASVTFTIPADTATGSYYIIEQVDPQNAVAESQETNNVNRTALVRVGPDLTVATFTGPTTAVAGATISVTDTTRNTGGAPADASTTHVYLSANVTLDAGDTLVGARNLLALDAGQSNAAPIAVTIPSGLVPGTYYLIAKADGPGTLLETNETNNTRVYTLRVSAPAP
jgi:subtilase family serine protease